MIAVYISGPITGKRNNNRRAFEKAYEKIEKTFGYEDGTFRIITPVKIAETVEFNLAEINRILLGKKKPAWEDYMRACIKRLCDATHAYFIKGRQASRGSVLERHIAEAPGIPCADSIDALKKIIEVRT